MQVSLRRWPSMMPRRVEDIFKREDIEDKVKTIAEGKSETVGRSRKRATCTHFTHCKQLEQSRKTSTSTHGQRSTWTSRMMTSMMCGRWVTTNSNQRVSTTTLFLVRWLDGGETNDPHAVAHADGYDVDRKTSKEIADETSLAGRWLRRQVSRHSVDGARQRALRSGCRKAQPRIRRNRKHGISQAQRESQVPAG